MEPGDGAFDIELQAHYFFELCILYSAFYGRLLTAAMETSAGLIGQRDLQDIIGKLAEDMGYREGELLGKYGVLPEGDTLSPYSRETIHPDSPLYQNAAADEEPRSRWL